MSKPNTYVVILGVNVSGYEKLSRHLVEAEDEDGAHLAALEMERHNDLHIDDYGHCWDDIFIYKCCQITKVDENDVSVLEKYL